MIQYQLKILLDFNVKAQQLKSSLPSAEQLSNIKDIASIIHYYFKLDEVLKLTFDEMKKQFNLLLNGIPRENDLKENTNQALRRLNFWSLYFSEQNNSISL